MIFRVSQSPAGTLAAPPSTPALRIDVAVALALAVHALVLLVAPAADAGPGAPVAARVDVHLLARPAPSPAMHPRDTVPKPQRTDRPAAPARQAVADGTLTAAGDTPAAAESSAPPSPAETRADTAEVVNADAQVPFTEAHVDTRYHDIPAPPYPPLSRRLGESGEVILRVQVGADGSVLGVQVERSSGYPRLDNAARKAVTSWRFVPARHGDVAIESSARVPLRFVLES